MAERIPGLAVFWLSVRRSSGTVHGAPQRFLFGTEASAFGVPELHVEQGIGVSFLVKVGALVGPEVHVLVKADGLRFVEFYEVLFFKRRAGDSARKFSNHSDASRRDLKTNGVTSGYFSRRDRITGRLSLG